MGSDIFAKFSAYIKNPRKEANISKKCGWALRGCDRPRWGWGRDAFVLWANRGARLGFLLPSPPKPPQRAEERAGWGKAVLCSMGWTAPGAGTGESGSWG